MFDMFVNLICSVEKHSLTPVESLWNVILSSFESHLIWIYPFIIINYIHDAYPWNNIMSHALFLYHSVSLPNLRNCIVRFQMCRVYIIDGAYCAIALLKQVFISRRTAYVRFKLTTPLSPSKTSMLQMQKEKKWKLPCGGQVLLRLSLVIT